MSYSRRVPEVPCFLWFQTFSILIVQYSPFISKPDFPLKTMPHPGFLSTFLDGYMEKLEVETRRFCDQYIKIREAYTAST